MKENRQEKTNYNLEDDAQRILSEVGWENVVETEPNRVVDRIPKYNEELSDKALRFLSSINWETTNVIEVDRNDKPPYDVRNRLKSLIIGLASLSLLYSVGKSYVYYETIWNSQFVVSLICFIGYAILMIENGKLKGMLDRIYEPNKYFKEIYKDKVK